MKIFFILNPSSHKKQWDYRQIAAQTARRYGAMPRFGEIDRHNPRSAENHLIQAHEEGCTRVVVIGGDGTLHRVINALHRQKRLDRMEIAAVPGGTCNDFARLLGFSFKKIEESMRMACKGTPEWTDLGRMGDELFLNNAGFGRANPVTEPTSKPLQTLRQFRPIHLKAQWERGTLEGDFYMVLACNGPYFSRGLYMSRRPRVVDGYLDVYFVPGMAKWRLLPLLVWGRLGRPVKSRHMINLRLHTLDIQTETDVWPQVDGEVVPTPKRQMRFSMAQEKAMIVIPDKIPVAWTTD